METLPPPPVPPKKFGLHLFAPSPAIPLKFTDNAAIQQAYRSWRARILLSSIIGYATFYFVRKNLAVAMPAMERELHISKTDLGLFLTLHGVLYGISKFANGFAGDRCNARAFMVTGLAISAAINVLFGFSSAVVALGILWMLNGWFQGMGFPPCARLLTHWFPPNQLATKMSIWNISHSIGAGLIVVMCAYLVVINWRLCFLVPAAIAFACVILIWVTLPDTPQSLGLPEVEGTQIAPAGVRPSSGAGTLETLSAEDFKSFLMEHVFRNKYIWLVAIANFFVYVLRYAVFDWGPTMLTQAKHLSIVHAGWIIAGFEISGLLGALLAGWLTDRFFAGRATRACLFFMILAGISLFLFWKIAGQSKWLNTTLLCCAGFFIYGPQCLVGIAAANLATKRAAATAVGLTGLFGYLSTVLSGWGFGALVKQRGWDAGFAGLLGIAAIGTLVFAAAWPASAHGYGSITNDARDRRPDQQ